MSSPAGAAVPMSQAYQDGSPLPLYGKYSKKHVTVFKGAYHLARKSGNFGLKANGRYFYRNSIQELWSTFKGTPLFPFGLERLKFTYHLRNFPVSSLSSAENNNRKLNCKW